MTPWDSLLDVLVLLAAAFLLGAICERLRQSAILGYLAAGTLLGPNALNWISNQADVELLAELGVALLLFTIGLEFSWRRLRQLGSAALVGGTLQVVITMALAGLLAMLIGRPLSASIAIGAMIALSSTATVLRLLTARAEIDSMHGRSVLGVLLVQDLAVVPLVLLVSTMGTGGTAAEIAWSLGRALLLATALVAAFLIIFNTVVPLILGALTAQRNRELPVLLAIIVGLGSSLAAHKAGLSPALGAFAAGALLGSTTYATQIRSDVGSLRTLLMTLFFSSVGMFGSPGWIAANALPVLAVVLAIVIGKSAIVWGLLRMLGLAHRGALAAGLCLAQVGEFSFVLVSVARRSDIIGEYSFMLIVSATIGTLFLTPYLVSGAPRVASLTVTALRRLGIIRAPAAPRSEIEGPAGDHVVIVGFGPAGQVVGEMLLGQARHVLVLDLGRQPIAAARRLDFEVQLGDATHPDVLDHARIQTAAAVVVTIPQPDDARRVIQLVRAMAPDALILARARYHVYRYELEFAGAHAVIDEEQHVGERLARELRRRFRARDVTPE
ncbi:MAG: cation:proton antiporter [Planctomycetota bacterium]